MRSHPRWLRGRIFPSFFLDEHKRAIFNAFGTIPALFAEGQIGQCHCDRRSVSSAPKTGEHEWPVIQLSPSKDHSTDRPDQSREVSFRTLHTFDCVVTFVVGRLRPNATYQALDLQAAEACLSYRTPGVIGKMRRIRPNSIQ